LEVKPSEWIPFLLCRAPETDEDVRALAERFGADRERLGRALRSGE
jgi:hypothetical protein